MVLRIAKLAATIGLSLHFSLPALAEEWVPLFNGKDLSGWTPKITGQPLGEDVKQTFRVEDGLIRVDYSRYAAFEGAFGHLFFEHAFEAYKLRLEYRFHGEQAKGGPGWAFRNSGVMVLAQSPESMGTAQYFPVSIEFQFLGQKGQGKRPTGSLCTPGTHVEIEGKLETDHCIVSSAETYPGDGWVKAEIHVLPGGLIRHFIEGNEVLSYSAPQLDPTDADAGKLIGAGQLPGLSRGYIALQAESHPVDFRNIEIFELKSEH